jgi:hypothetical protein
MLSIKAHFDGKGIILDEPLDLPNGQALIVHIEPALDEPVRVADLKDGWSSSETRPNNRRSQVDWLMDHDSEL